MTDFPFGMSEDTFIAVGADIEWVLRKLKWSWALTLALLVMVLTQGCITYTHEPPVTLAQHRADLKVCVSGAPIWHGAGYGTGSNLAAAANAAALVGSIVNDYYREQARDACMAARGYRLDGVTFKPWGYGSAQ
jgi:hypothetical protein